MQVLDAMMQGCEEVMQVPDGIMPVLMPWCKTYIDAGPGSHDLGSSSSYASSWCNYESPGDAIMHAMVVIMSPWCNNSSCRQ